MDDLIRYARRLVRGEEQHERLDAIAREYFESLTPEGQRDALERLEAWLGEHEAPGDQVGGDVDGTAAEGR